MAELMNTNSYPFETLAAMHGMFRAPAFKILSGTSDISADLGLHADSLEIQQTIKNKSGQCRFTIKDAYDLQKRRFTDAFKNAFPLGQPVEAYLGYGQPRLMFKGFVADVSFAFSSGDAPSVTVVCSDIRALMLQGRLNAMPFLSSFPVVAALLMAYYTSLFNMRFTYYDLWNILEDFRQNTNDFDYINSYAEKRGYEFFVLGDYSYFRKKKSNTVPVTTLSWGEGLISFNRHYTYTASSLKGVLNSVLSLLPFDADKLVKPEYPNKMVSLKNIDFHMDTSGAKNTLDLINMMASYALSLTDDIGGGDVSCVGIPEIVPGRYITIKNLDADFLDNTYYIEEVTHSLSGSGYTTSFSVSSGLGSV